MKKTMCLLTITLIMGFCTQSFAQSDEEKKVQKVIEQLFDGMRNSDSSMVRNSFIENAIMQTVAVDREGKALVHTGKLQPFLDAVGSPKNQLWDERIGKYTILIDDNLASVWTPYSFYVGDTFSHCGVNSFQLIKTEDDWKIFFIVDTRRNTNCVESL